MFFQLKILYVYVLIYLKLSTVSTETIKITNFKKYFCIFMSYKKQDMFKLIKMIIDKT